MQPGRTAHAPRTAPPRSAPCIRSQRYHFSSSLRRMSAVVRVEDEVRGPAGERLRVAAIWWRACLLFDAKDAAGGLAAFGPSRE
jgi:hypothetical protein